MSGTESEVGQNNACGGSGAGGYLYLNAQTLIYGNDTLINASGASCNENCASGGAGSAGEVVIDTI